MESIFIIELCLIDTVYTMEEELFLDLSIKKSTNLKALRSSEFDL